MSHPSEASLGQSGWAGRWTPSSPLSVVPSWLISLALHALLLVGIATGLRSCEKGPSGDGEGELRQVGIYLSSSSDLVERIADENDPANDDATFPHAFTEADQESVVDDAPPADLTTPSLPSPREIIGAGVLPSVTAAADPRDFIRPSGPFRPPRLGALAQGETSFFGIKDNASHFVYLLDASGSMAGVSIRAAKAELIRSIEALEKTQQFQIIFYNQTPSVLKLRGAENAPMIWATTINKTLAKQEISGVVPVGGTLHMPAIRKALRLNPEVLFFLTDADDPLRKGDLNEIKRINKGRTRIHCIEFGKAGDLGVGNFLKRLASQNGGTYRYRDVTKFERKR